MRANHYTIVVQVYGLSAQQCGLDAHYDSRTGYSSAITQLTDEATNNVIGNGTNYIRIKKTDDHDLLILYYNQQK